MEERRPHEEWDMDANPGRSDRMRRIDDPARKADHGKRKAGAVVFAVVTIVIMLLYILLFLGILLMGGNDPVSVGVAVVMVVIPVVVIAGVVYACRERMKEIEGGELDEADKY